MMTRDIPPCEGAVRITGVRPDGFPDGVHTGGAWLAGEIVYKPLDGRPYVNCEEHYPTQEAEFLEAMAREQVDLFPRNWWIEERNGRRFLVRKRALIVPPTEMGRDLLVRIEKAVRRANALGWEIGDAITVGLDKSLYAHFIVDLSTAQQVSYADDEHHVRRLFEWAGDTWLLALRQNARRVIADAKWRMEHFGQGFEQVYASFYRPVSLMWASFPCEVKLVHTERADWGNAVPHTWVIAKESLPERVIDSYQLVEGWLG